VLHEQRVYLVLLEALLQTALSDIDPRGRRRKCLHRCLRDPPAALHGIWRSYEARTGVEGHAFSEPYLGSEVIVDYHLSLSDECRRTQLHCMTRRASPMVTMQYSVSKIKTTSMWASSHSWQRDCENRDCSLASTQIASAAPSDVQGRLAPLRPASTCLIVWRRHQICRLQIALHLSGTG